MSKKPLLVLLLVSALAHTEDNNPLQLIRRHHTRYLIPLPSRQITLYNSTAGAILARYQRPDPGYSLAFLSDSEKRAVLSIF